MAHVPGAGGQRRLGDAPDGDHPPRAHQREHEPAGLGAADDLRARRPAVRERLVEAMGMGRHGVPEEHPPLGAEARESAPDDRRRGLAPALRPRARRPVRRSPGEQVALARERHAGEAEAGVPARLADADDVGAPALAEVPAQVGEPHDRRAGERPGPVLAVRVERRADSRAGEQIEQLVHRREGRTRGRERGVRRGWYASRGSNHEPEESL
jgi:hypothetical protein